MNREIMKTFAKLLFTGATILGIAFAVGVFTPDAEVRESEADIIALDFAPKASHEKMASALEDLGHDEPWPLDVNGNLVYFSTKVHQDEPQRVMQDYLRKFHEHGLNRDDYSEGYGDDWDTIGLDAFEGGVVPMVMEKDHIVLGGMDLTAHAESGDDLRAVWRDHNPEEFEELFEGFRHITIDRDGPETLVSSVWSDGNFDYKKMDFGGRQGDVNASTEFPSCPGCIRLNSFESLDSKRPYQSASYAGMSRGLDDTALFYRRSLAKRGWEPTEADQMMGKVREHVEFEGKAESRMLQFARQGRFMTVVLHQKGNKVVANMSISD